MGAAKKVQYDNEIESEEVESEEQVGKALEDAPYTLVELEVIKSIENELNFDVYVRRTGNKFTKIFKKGSKVDLERFEAYQKKGTNTLYIHNENRKKYLNILMELLTPDKIFKNRTTKILQEISEQTFLEIFKDTECDQQTIDRVITISDTYLSTIQSNPKIMASFIENAKSTSYHCKHAIATSVFSCLIAMHLGITDRETLSYINLGSLLHDIGMTKIEQDIGLKDRSLTDAEWKKIKDHPSMGKEILEDFENLNPNIIKIIEQHHEHFSGSGYPYGLEGEEIYFPAQIVSVASAFVALTSKRGGRPIYQPEHAVFLMFTDGGKFNPDIVQALAELLNLDFI